MEQKTGVDAPSPDCLHPWCLEEERVGGKYHLCDRRAPVNISHIGQSALEFCLEALQYAQCGLKQKGKNKIKGTERWEKGQVAVKGLFQQQSRGTEELFRGNLLKGKEF